jgi:hypothetical protein
LVICFLHLYVFYDVYCVVYGVICITLCVSYVMYYMYYILCALYVIHNTLLHYLIHYICTTYTPSANHWMTSNSNTSHTTHYSNTSLLTLNIFSFRFTQHDVIGVCFVSLKDIIETFSNHHKHKNRKDKPPSYHSFDLPIHFNGCVNGRLEVRTYTIQITIFNFEVYFFIISFHCFMIS